MKVEEQNIDKLLDDFFTLQKREKRGAEIEERIRKQILKEKYHRIKRMIFPIAAMLLVFIGTTFLLKEKKISNKKIAESQILYQDEDFVLYIEPSDN